MRKITFLLMATFVMVALNGQNKLQNGGFEDDPATFTVQEGTNNVLRRVANIVHTTTQTANPTSTAVAVTPGMWVKKAPNSGYLKSIVTTEDKHSGNSALHYQNRAGNGGAKMDVWYQTIACQQKVSNELDKTKKYTVKFWAKVDDTASNVCDKVIVWLRAGNENKTKSISVDLTGGTTWTEYTVTIDLPTFSATHPTATYTTSYFGISCPTTYNAEGKTNYAGVFLDDISLEKKKENSTAVNDVKEQPFTTYSFNNTVYVKGAKAGQNIAVFNTLGAQVKTLKSEQNVTSINIPQKGVYLIRVNETTQKVLVK